MKPTIYFDMDGTLADLYNVPDWQSKLEAEDVTPFIHAKPLFKSWALSTLLCELQRKGYRIGIISWTPKDARWFYAAQVEKAKRFWLRQYLLVNLDEIRILPYGSPKWYNTKAHDILFDDEEPNRLNWLRGEAYKPEEIFPVLTNL